MAFGGFNKESQGAPLAEINMVPLIDVMLVLLVIFIVTAPLLTHAVKVDLPKASSQPNETKADNIQFAISDKGGLYWNGESVEKATLPARFAVEAKRTPQPELHLRAEKTTPYQTLAEVMAEASKAGLVRIGFISEPTR